MTTIIIADDHEIVRRGLRSLLESTGTCRIVAEVADGLAAGRRRWKKFRPNLLFLDLNMPRAARRHEVLKQSRSSSPQTRVIVLSMHNDEPYVVESLRAGAAAYLLKGSESEEIGQALKEVLCWPACYLSAPLSSGPSARSPPAHPTPPIQSLRCRLASARCCSSVEGCSGRDCRETVHKSAHRRAHRTNVCQTRSAKPDRPRPLCDPQGPDRRLIREHVAQLISKRAVSYKLRNSTLSTCSDTLGHRYPEQRLIEDLFAKVSRTLGSFKRSMTDSAIQPSRSCMRIPLL